MSIRELIQELERLGAGDECEVILHDACLVVGVQLIGERVVVEIDCYCGYAA